MLFVLFAFAGCGVPAERAEEPETTRESGILEVYVFGFLSADAIVVKTENYTVMIDTGERQHGNYILNWLFYRDIVYIDYLIITHFDRDHVGSAHYIINFMEVQNVIVPNYQRISNTVRRFENAMLLADIEAFVLLEEVSLTLDDAEITMYPSVLDFFVFSNEDDDNDYIEDVTTPRENDFSIVVTISHGEKKFIFMGDAMAGRLSELLEMDEIFGVSFDFLKLPHHGRYNRLSTEFLKAINPRYAVSTCCTERPTDERIVTVLEYLGTEIFFSKNGGVRVRSDGLNLVVVQ